MSLFVQRLETTGAAMREAMAKGDWASIAELDQQCRVAVEEAMVESVKDEKALRERMEELLALYRQLIGACQTEQKRLASELIQLNQSHQGAKVYQLFG
jgi:flagellar protein FliT